MRGGMRECRAVMMAAVLAASATVFGQATATAPAVNAGGGGGGARYLAGRLVDDARRQLRDSSLDPATAAKQAVILLTFAQNLDEAGAAIPAPNAPGPDVSIPRMLAEAARAAGDVPARKEALRKIIGLDHGDLVAQVAYLDLLAGATQVLEERAHIFQSALDNKGLSPQVQSEMAVRLAEISEERGDAENQRAYYLQALSLNDVNVTALRGLARLAGDNPNAVPERVSALVALLIANAYEPDAWVELARICEGANLHQRAADFLLVALEQMQIEGAAPSGDMYLEYGLELAIAGRRAEGFAIVNGLARLPDAPLTAVAVAEILAATDVPGSGLGGGDATRPEKDVAAQRVRKAAQEISEGTVPGAAPEANAAALADAAGLLLTALPTLDPQASTWVDAYAKLVAPEDTTLLRLRGWVLYRSGKLDEARAALEKAAAPDPMAQVGLARVLIAQNKIAEATRQLQDLWSGHPRGLIALQVTETARAAGITLNDTQWSRQIRDAAARLPAAVMNSHRQPREIVLTTAALRKVSVGLGEAGVITIRMTNATDRPVPVGPNGLAVTSVGLSATVRGTTPTPLGVIAVEDIQRIYRLEPHGVMETTIRLDQGPLADVFERNPLRTFTIAIGMATAPRVTAGGEVVPGLGGQQLYLGDFQRGGMPIATPADFEKLRADLAGATGDKLQIRIRMAEALLAPLAPNLPAPGSTPAATQQSALQESARNALIASLLPLAESTDPLVRAAFIRSFPPGAWGDAVEKVLAKLADDSDPLVRILWAQHQAALAHAGGDEGNAAEVSLRQQAAVEKDDTVKQWLALELVALKPSASTQAAPTQP